MDLSLRLGTGALYLLAECLYLHTGPKANLIKLLFICKITKRIQYSFFLEGISLFPPWIHFSYLSVIGVVMFGVSLSRPDIVQLFQAKLLLQQKELSEP